MLAACVLATLGARTLVAGPREIADLPESPPTSSPANLSGRALAEAFTRVYLSWDPRRPQLRAEALRPLLSGGMGEDAGLRMPPGGPAWRVLWTAVLSDQERSAGGRLITVAAETNRGTVRLAVPVAPDPSGAFVVTARPAIVGAPRTDPGRAVPAPDVVENEALVAVARRTLANYLAGDRANLLADLAPGAVVVLPEPMGAVRVGEVTWVDRASGLVAVEAAASVRGRARAQLRYEIAVASQGRWLVSWIGTP